MAMWWFSLPFLLFHSRLFYSIFCPLFFLSSFISANLVFCRLRWVLTLSQITGSSLVALYARLVIPSLFHWYGDYSPAFVRRLTLAVGLPRHSRTLLFHFQFIPLRQYSRTLCCEVRPVPGFLVNPLCFKLSVWFDRPYSHFEYLQFEWIGFSSGRFNSLQCSFPIQDFYALFLGKSRWPSVCSNRSICHYNHLFVYPDFCL